MRLQILKDLYQTVNYTNATQLKLYLNLFHTQHLQSKEFIVCTFFINKKQYFN